MDSPTKSSTGSAKGIGPNGPFPPELASGLNGGAFGLGFIWGYAHNVWQGMLSLPLFLLPIVINQTRSGYCANGQYFDTGNPHAFYELIASAIVLFIYMVYLGIMGNKLAWRHRKFESIEQFKAVQRAWETPSLIVLSIVILDFVFYYFVSSFNFCIS